MVKIQDMKSLLRTNLGQTYDKALLVDDEVEIVVQVNGKLRAKIKIAKDTSKEEMQELPYLMTMLKRVLKVKTS